MHRPSLSLSLVLALLVPGWVGFRAAPDAAAAERVVDTVLGAEFEEPIAAGDVDAYLVRLVAGTSLRLRLSAEDAAGKDGASGPRPELVALDPLGGEMGRVLAGGGELARTATAAGTYRIEVRAGMYSGAYELKIEGRPPESRPERSESRVDVVAGLATVVHVDAPPASVVEIEIRRRSGAAPRIDAVTDGLARPLTPFVREARRSRIRLEPMVVAVVGGLDVSVSGRDGGAGRYEFRARVRTGSDRPSGGDPHESRRVVVQLAAGADPAAVALANGWTLVEVEGGIAVYETPEDRDGHEEEDAEYAEGHDGVVVAAPDVLAGLPEGSQANAPIVGSDIGRAAVEQQLATTQVRAAAAHALATGVGVVVAVLDGGVDSGHPFFDGRVLPGWDFVDRDADASEATNGLDDDGDGLVDEGYGHGTFVSSLILAAAPRASILPVRVLDTDGAGRSSDIAFGIEWAADHGAKVMNLSFGTLGGNAAIASAIRYAQNRGVTVVASTGNDGSATVIDFPAALAGVVSVTALGTTGLRAPFTNGARATTIAAPGADLLGAFPDGRSATWSGTSFAAALVSGGAALFVERWPASSPAKVAAALVRRAKPFRPAVPRADRRRLGAGVLDLLRLVR